jgi:CheY-like chemotaxis protein
VTLPQLGGERLLAELRARPRLADAAVIVLTAQADEELRRWAWRCRR